MAGRAIPGPSSASPRSDSHVQYGGSRTLRTRFRYKDPNSLSAFVELAPKHVATPEMLYNWLEGCQLVERVEWQTSKTSQGCIGNHMSEHNIKVFPKQGTGSAMQGFIEFAITRHGHMSSEARCPYTVTVMFKNPPAHFFCHAWEILRAVCCGKELFPDMVDEWMKDALRKHRGQEQEDAQEEEEPALASASAEPSNDAPAEEEEEEPPARLGEVKKEQTGVDGVMETSIDFAV